MVLNDMSQGESNGGYSAPSSGYGDRYGRYRSHHFVKKVRIIIESGRSIMLQADTSIIKQRGSIFLDKFILLLLK